MSVWIKHFYLHWPATVLNVHNSWFQAEPQVQIQTVFHRSSHWRQDCRPVCTSHPLRVCVLTPILHKIRIYKDERRPCEDIHQHLWRPVCACLGRSETEGRCSLKCFFHTLVVKGFLIVSSFCSTCISWCIYTQNHCWQSLSFVLISQIILNNNNPQKASCIQIIFATINFSSIYNRS